jgi:thiosulfate/3-mercaptopyruvate sulfurtransferase
MTARTAFRRIDVGEAQALLARDGVMLLDVRAADAFRAGSIDGARHLTMAEISAVLSATPKDTPVLIYCYRGNASQEYAQIFSDFRFREVYSLDGGYEAWSRR